MGNSKSGVHNRIEKILPVVNKELYKKVRKVLDKNNSKKHIRGGMAKKKKYSRNK